jgi:hypothetical protein
LAESQGLDPHTQIQSSLKGASYQQTQQLSLADQGEVRQNPQRLRDEIEGEENTLP